MSERVIIPLTVPFSLTRTHFENLTNGIIAFAGTPHQQLGEEDPSLQLIAFCRVVSPPFNHISCQSVFTNETNNTASIKNWNLTYRVAPHLCNRCMERFIFLHRDQFATTNITCFY